MCNKISCVVQGYIKKETNNLCVLWHSRVVYLKKLLLPETERKPDNISQINFRKFI